MKLNLRLLYLYLFSFVGLIIVVFGAKNLVNLGLNTFVFKDADRYEIYDTPVSPDSKLPAISKEEQTARQERDLKRQRERQLSDALSAIVIGTPLYLYHWRIIQKDSIKEKLA